MKAIRLGLGAVDPQLAADLKVGAVQPKLEAELHPYTRGGEGVGDTDQKPIREVIPRRKSLKETVRVQPPRAAKASRIYN